MFNPKFIISWAFLLSGLILTISAILVPAMGELDSLKSKHAVIVKSRDQMLVQKTSYEEFLVQIQLNDPAIQKRIKDMQFNLDPDGTPIVIDTGAPNTPLQWIERKMSQSRDLQIPDSHTSLLLTISKGTRRLWLAGFGITVIFLGIVLTPLEQ